MPISNDYRTDDHDELLKEGTDITGVTMPVGGNSARGWLSAIWQSLRTVFPSALSSDRFKAESSHLAPVEINVSATALGDILPETDVSNYRFASVSVNSNIAANQMRYEARNSQTSIWFSIPVEQRLSPNGSYLTITPGTSNIFCVPLAYKYFRITLVAYTANTTSNITVLLYQHPPERLTVIGRVLIDGGTVATSLPAASALSDSISRSLSTPTVGSVNLLDNNTSLVRWRSPSVTLGEGFGRGKVAVGTEPISLGTGITNAPTNGSTIGLGSAYSKITMQLAYSTSTLTAINCELQGSLNGFNWFTLATLTDFTSGARIVSSDVPITHIRYKLNSLTGTSLSIQLLACCAT